MYLSKALLDKISLKKKDPYYFLTHLSLLYIFSTSHPSPLRLLIVKIHKVLYGKGVVDYHRGLEEGGGTVERRAVNDVNGPKSAIVCISLFLLTPLSFFIYVVISWFWRQCKAKGVDLLYFKIKNIKVNLKLKVTNRSNL